VNGCADRPGSRHVWRGIHRALTLYSMRQQANPPVVFDLDWNQGAMLDVSHDSDVTTNSCCAALLPSPPAAGAPKCNRPACCHAGLSVTSRRWRRSARTQHRLQVGALRQARATLHLPLCILEQDARRALETHLDHQDLIGIKLACDLATDAR